MMGYAHALTGLAGGAATAEVVAPHSLAGRAGWTVVCGGMALLADLDHPSSTIARMWGPFSQTLARIVCKLAGGHRGITHDIVVAPALASGLAWLASHWFGGQLVLLAFGIGLGLRAIGAGIPGREFWDPWPVNAGLSWGGAWWLASHGWLAPGWLAFAAGLGVVIHILGDSLTEQGVPVPLSWLPGRREARWRLASLSADSRWLNWPAAGLSLAAVGWLAYSWPGVPDLHLASVLQLLIDSSPPRS
jgi:membrane-bound metal-dependent hydrolase YbcI (DUF457 family)